MSVSSWFVLICSLSVLIVNQDGWASHPLCERPVLACDQDPSPEPSQVSDHALCLPAWIGEGAPLSVPFSSICVGGWAWKVWLSYLGTRSNDAETFACFRNNQTLVCNPFVFQHGIFYLKIVMLITFLGAGETSLIAELGEKQCPSNLITVFSHVPFSGHWSILTRDTSHLVSLGCLVNIHQARLLFTRATCCVPTHPGPRSQSSTGGTWLAWCQHG